MRGQTCAIGPGDRPSLTHGHRACVFSHMSAKSPGLVQLGRGRQEFRTVCRSPSARRVAV